MKCVVVPVLAFIVIVFLSGEDTTGLQEELEKLRKVCLRLCNLDVVVLPLVQGLNVRGLHC